MPRKSEASVLERTLTTLCLEGCAEVLRPQFGQRVPTGEGDQSFRKRGAGSGQGSGFPVPIIVEDPLCEAGLNQPAVCRRTLVRSHPLLSGEFFPKGSATCGIGNNQVEQQNIEAAEQSKLR